MKDIDFCDRTQYESSSQYAYRAIRAAIMDLSLEPGCVLNDTEIANKLNVSKTPIREAMMRLRNENLLDIYPQKGSRVSLINFNLATEGMNLRQIVEAAIYADISGNVPDSTKIQLIKNLEYQHIIIKHHGAKPEFFALDSEFHRIIYEGANRSATWAAVSTVTTHYDRMRFLDILSGNYRLAPVYEEHQTIFDMLTNKRSREDFEPLCEEHLHGINIEMQKILREYADYYLH